MSLKDKFTGTGIAIVTPFLENGKIDWDSLKKLVDFWLKGKVEYLVVLGTTGESATVRGEEKQELFTRVKEFVAGRVPLVAGIGGYDTMEILADFKAFDLSGYDAILSVAPYYNKPNQEGLYQHYKTLDAHTPLPLMMYNVPGRTGQNMTAETQLRVARDCSKIFATKEASGNLEQVMQIIKHKPKDFLVISGDDGIALPMIALGAVGVTSVVANAYPAAFSDMIRACLAGNFSEALPEHYKYIDIITSLFAEGSPAGIKTYLSELGLCKLQFRQPVWPVSATLHDRIRELMKTVN